MFKSKRSGFSVSQSVLAASCFGMMLISAVSLTGCAGKSAKQEAKKPDALQMQIESIEQLSGMGDKVPDGQYLVVKANIKNLINKSITLTPAEFKLENITTDEAQRYSQPAERAISNVFSKEYGKENKAKLMDTMPSNLYPRLEMERFFVFMVPSNAEVKEYQLTYAPLVKSKETSEKVSVPLVSPQTTINDHRRNNPISASPRP